MRSSGGLRLAELVADPGVLDELDRDELGDVLADLERLKAKIWTRLARPLGPENTAGVDAETDDRMLPVDEAAEILGVEPRWLYDRSDELPFAKKLAPRTLRFSERGLYRWLESRP